MSETSISDGTAQACGQAAVTKSLTTTSGSSVFTQEIVQSGHALTSSLGNVGLVQIGPENSTAVGASYLENQGDVSFSVNNQSPLRYALHYEGSLSSMSPRLSTPSTESPPVMKPKRGRKKKVKPVLHVDRQDSPCPNVDVRHIPAQASPAPFSVQTTVSFFENPTAYLAQQTALLNKTMSPHKHSPVYSTNCDTRPQQQQTQSLHLGEVQRTSTPPTVIPLPGTLHVPRKTTCTKPNVTQSGTSTQSTTVPNKKVNICAGSNGAATSEMNISPLEKSPDSLCTATNDVETPVSFPASSLLSAAARDAFRDQRACQMDKNLNSDSGKSLFCVSPLQREVKDALSSNNEKLMPLLTLYSDCELSKTVDCIKSTFLQQDTELAAADANGCDLVEKPYVLPATTSCSSLVTSVSTMCSTTCSQEVCNIKVPITKHGRCQDVKKAAVTPCAVAQCGDVVPAAALLSAKMHTSLNSATSAATSNSSQVGVSTNGHYASAVSLQGAAATMTQQPAISGSSFLNNPATLSTGTTVTNSIPHVIPAPGVCQQQPQPFMHVTSTAVGMTYPGIPPIQSTVMLQNPVAAPPTIVHGVPAAPPNQVLMTNLMQPIAPLSQPIDVTAVNINGQHVVAQGIGQLPYQGVPAFQVAGQQPLSVQVAPPNGLLASQHLGQAPELPTHSGLSPAVGKQMPVSGSPGCNSGQYSQRGLKRNSSTPTNCFHSNCEDTSCRSAKRKRKQRGCQNSDVLISIQQPNSAPSQIMFLPPQQAPIPQPQLSVVQPGLVLSNPMHQNQIMQQSMFLSATGKVFTPGDIIGESLLQQQQQQQVYLCPPGIGGNVFDGMSTIPAVQVNQLQHMLQGGSTGLLQGDETAGQLTQQNMMLQTLMQTLISANPNVDVQSLLPSLQNIVNQALSQSTQQLCAPQVMPQAFSGITPDMAAGHSQPGTQQTSSQFQDQLPQMYNHLHVVQGGAVSVDDNRQIVAQQQMQQPQQQLMYNHQQPAPQQPIFAAQNNSTRVDRNQDLVSSTKPGVAQDNSSPISTAGTAVAGTAGPQTSGSIAANAFLVSHQTIIQNIQAPTLQQNVQQNIGLLSPEQPPIPQQENSALTQAASCNLSESPSLQQATSSSKVQYRIVLLVYCFSMSVLLLYPVSTFRKYS